MAGQNGLPPRFPCWCKATYSWGGESKKDLGFIEGDLIEALNAGDGSWWMGRLRRDPRAVGLFPSNFVTVLDEKFQPAPNSRHASSGVQTPPKQTSPVKTNSVFRKPYQAYGVVGACGSLDGVRDKEGTPESDREKAKKEKSKFRPYSSMKTAQAPTGSFRAQNGMKIAPVEDMRPRIPDPLPRGGSISSHSPLPSRNGSYAEHSDSRTYERPIHSQTQSRTPLREQQPRARSPMPQYRAPSPQPQFHAPSPDPFSRPRSPLPATYHDGSAYPQLLPSSRQPSPVPFEDHYHQPHHSRAPSPAPHQRADIDSSPPPPPPPAHRIAYQPSRAPSPAPQPSFEDDYHDDAHTPNGRSPNGSHMTPSPVRDAMNDVMSSLHDMSAFTRSPSPIPTRSQSNVWSPEEFELVRTQSRNQQQRAQSSLGFVSADEYHQGRLYQEGTGSISKPRHDHASISDYVQRMDSQLHRHSSFQDQPPQPPLKGLQYHNGRPPTSDSQSSAESHSQVSRGEMRAQQLRNRKSAYELGRDILNRTYTTKTNATNSTASSSATQQSNSTQATSRSLMSGYSAGGFSATSAGSLARRKFGMGSQRRARAMSVVDTRSNGDIASSARSMAATESSGSGPSYHESHASYNQMPPVPTPDWSGSAVESAGVLGGLGAPKARKSGFFKKMIETAKTTARTGAATARSTIGSATASRPGSRSGSPTKNIGGISLSGFGGGVMSRPSSSAGPSSAARDMGLGGGGSGGNNGFGNDWMQVRRDINRSNSLSHRERDERRERCEMLDLPAVRPVDHLNELVEGGEGLDGLAIAEPQDFNTPNLALVDKSTRFIQNVSGVVSAIALAQNYICRPHRTDVQRLRAIFTWVAERIAWEDDFEGHVDPRRVIQTKRGCSEEIALLVRDMCNAVGLHAETVRGYLKAPGEVLDLYTIARPNHWWNAVIVDGEWRLMDCALAGPTHPRRSAYSSASSQVAESWYFLARPTEMCYTHIPLLPEQQHIVPPLNHETLISLPCACPTYFRNNVELSEFDTSMLYLENLEMAHFSVSVPEDVECVAETETRAFAQDADGDFLVESGDLITKRAMSQATWEHGRKHFTIKALLPPTASQATLKVYAGKRGLMHSLTSNPHSLALALPLSHTGIQNPPYEFVRRHPTPHAQRHDLYIAQPQCARLTIHNTFVFTVRQHPSSLSRFTPDTWGANATTSTTSRPSSPNPFALVRPGSAMSMVSASVSGSASGSEASSNAGGMTGAQMKPAKLAIQSPSQKIVRLTRKVEYGGANGNGGGGVRMIGAGHGEDGDGMEVGSTWETVIKISERGTWRGLVLADRSARWCVFAEWEGI